MLVPMRLAWLLIVCALGRAASADSAPEPIDISAIRSQLAVYKTEWGAYVVVKPPTRGARSIYATLFYGDGKQMFQQIVTSGSVNESTFSAMTILNVGADVWTAKPKARFYCSSAYTVLTPLSATEAKPILDATYLPSIGPFHLGRLARDGTTYYYLERDARDAWHLYGGKRGAMKRLATSAVHADDTTIVAVLKGTNKRLTFHTTASPVLAEGKKTRTLSTFDPLIGTRMAYLELKIRGTKGVACADL